MRRSIVAAVDIPEGVKIERWMLAYKRPGTAISPARLAEVLGQQAARTIPEDTLIEFEDLR
jgi:sialic acid synthase SpsE